MAQQGVKWGQILEVAWKAVIVCIVLYIAYTLKKYYSDPSTRPSWLIGIINIGNPVKYNKMTGMYPYDSNISVIEDTHSTTANLCASNCSVVYNCNGIIWDSTCKQVTSNFGKAIMVPRSGVDTYFKTTSTFPKYGFVSLAKDLAFHSNVAKQHYGTISNEVNPEKLSNLCINQYTSNCVGFSTNVESNTTWFVNDYSNTEATSNVSSYVLTLLTGSRWTEV
jgi:hypothetical protein